MEQLSKTLTQTFTLVLVALIFFSLDRLGTLTNLQKVVAAPLEFGQIPVFIIKNNLVGRIEFLAQLSNIQKENITLSQKLATITAENAKLQQLNQENQALRTQLNLAQNREDAARLKTTLAKVLGSSHNLVIEAENPELVKVGDIVTFGNNFIGIVTQTGVKLTKVRLISDPASIVPAKILAPTGQILGNLTGRFGESLALEKIEKQEIIPVDSLILTAGDDNIPEGLVLGKVAGVKEADADPFLAIEVESLVDFSKLTTVFVLSKK